MPSLQLLDNVDAWVGGIPAGWKRVQLKHVATKLNRPIQPEDEIVICTNKGTVEYRGENNPGLVSLTGNGYQGVMPGDLLIHGMDTWHGAIAVSDVQGQCTSVVHVCDSSEDKRYLSYYLRALAFRGVYKAFSNGVRQNTSDFRSWMKAGEIPVALPPRELQARIADFLDAKCAEVDRAVSAAEQSIQEYKAYLDTLIAHKIQQAGGQRVKLSFFAESMLGKMLDQSQQRGINVHKYLANRDVQWFRLDTSDLSKMDFPEDSFERYGIEDGDILACEGGEVGRCAVYRGESPDFYFQKAIHRIRVDQTIAHPEFIAYQMFSKSKTGNFMEVRRGQATFNHLTGEQLRQLRFALPSLDEQQHIADFLDMKRAEFDRAVAAKQAIIDELKSYKQSLIYEAVTGKLEV